MPKLYGKVALVTGGSSGIDLATAKRFVEEGAFVYITGRRQAELDKAISLIGGSVAAERGDVSNLADLDRLYTRIASEKGKIDILCLSKIKSEHIRGAIPRVLGDKECALPSSRCAIGARPYPRPSACASHYSSERKISESGADVPRLRQ